MGQVMPDITANAYLDFIALCDRMVVCSAEPSDYNDALNVVDLATATLTPGDGNDFTHANDTSGRKTTVSAKAGVTIDHSGDATHVALLRTGDTSLRYITTCTLQALVAAGTVDFPAWKVNIKDPT